MTQPWIAAENGRKEVVVQVSGDVSWQPIHVRCGCFHECRTVGARCLWELGGKPLIGCCAVSRLPLRVGRHTEPNDRRHYLWHLRNFCHACSSISFH